MKRILFCLSLILCISGGSFVMVQGIDKCTECKRIITTYDGRVDILDSIHHNSSNYTVEGFIFKDGKPKKVRVYDFEDIKNAESNDPYINNLANQLYKSN